MGLLDFDGEPLDWKDIEPHVEYVKHHGIVQFLNNYERLMKRPEDSLKWGDEVEYMIVQFDHANRQVQLSLRGEEICNKLQEKERNSIKKQEYASYMVEGTPGVPYLGYMAQFNVVEANMRMRRKEVQEHLKPNEQIMSLTVFPRLGCFDFTNPKYNIAGPNSNPVSRSLFFPDQAIGSHPRFPFLTQNIRKRKGEKVAINVPIFRDSKTPSPFLETFDDPEANAAAKPDHIYMDCMGFGMGNCCLQMTFQACNIEEAKLLYDQLAPVCPIMLALSAASPIYRGYLSDIDTRWQVIAGSVDDRTEEERGLKPLHKNKLRIRKSRYDSIDSYLSKNSEVFNDVQLEIDEGAKKMLIEAGLDELLSNHIAHLWIRDPLSLFSRKIELNDEIETDHFEVEHTVNKLAIYAIQTSPTRIINRLEGGISGHGSTAYRFRKCCICRFHCLADKSDSYIQVDQNMAWAQENNAVKKQNFFFRKNVITSGTPSCCTQLCSNNIECSENGEDFLSQPAENVETKPAICEKMSIDTIINGKANVFPGFIPLIRRYLDSVEIEVNARCSITEYLNLISKRAAGEYMTAAQWMRHFVLSHPDYQQDSRVNDSIAYDLLVRCDQIEKGVVKCHQLFGIPQHKSEYVN